MENTLQNSKSFDEKQSLQVIRDMIHVSQNKVNKDGILFIVWGYLMSAGYIIGFINKNIITTYHLNSFLKIIAEITPLLGTLFTIYYIFKQRKKVRTYIGVSLRYLWISMFVCLSLTNMIMFNVIHEVNFDLQHPIFMVFIAFATLITGVIIRYKIIIVGGILFGALAYLSSYFELQTQVLLEAAAWIVAFVIPGHIMYAKRNN